MNCKRALNSSSQFLNNYLLFSSNAKLSLTLQCLGMILKL